MQGTSGLLFVLTDNSERGHRIEERGCVNAAPVGFSEHRIIFIALKMQMICSLLYYVICIKHILPFGD